MKKIILLILLVSCFSLSVMGETDSTYSFDNKKSRLMLNMGFLYGDNIRILNFSFDHAIYSHNSKLEYSYPLLPTNLVKRKSDDKQRYSYSGPITVGILLLRVGIEKLFYPNHTESFTANPDIIDYILFAPNSSIKYKLNPKFSIGLRTTTDYLLDKKNNHSRGILFTPAIEFSIHTGGNNIDKGVYTFSLINSSFINFDGDNQNEGVGIKFSFYVNGLYN